MHAVFSYAHFEWSFTYTQMHREITEFMKLGARKKLYFLSIGPWRFNAGH